MVIPLLTAPQRAADPIGLGVRVSPPVESAGCAPREVAHGTGATATWPRRSSQSISARRWPGAREPRTDAMHITVTSVNSLLIVLAIGFGSAAFGGLFRRYSVGTILGSWRSRGLDGYPSAAARGGSADAVGRRQRARQHRRLPPVAGRLAAALLRAEAEAR